eukprot:s1697_g4.t1
MRPKYDAHHRQAATTCHKNHDSSRQQDMASRPGYGAWMDHMRTFFAQQGGPPGHGKYVNRLGLEGSVFEQI